MPCSFPLDAIRDSGGVRILGAYQSGPRSGNVLIPCGQCTRCRLERSRQWAVRLMHESKSWQHNAFTTFTYADDKLPPLSSLRYPDFQGFMHRLRARVNYRKKKTDRSTVRFFCAGEYGTRSARPHYHALLFNLQIPDLVKYSGSDDNVLYRSEWLDALWTHGQTKTGALTFESAAYCARYCLDKVTGDSSAYHYRVVRDFDTGEMDTIEPEFCHMSRRPGIGHNWFRKFHTDVYPHGTVITNGKEAPTTKYYDRLYKRQDPQGFEDLTERRIIDGESRASDNTRARRLVKHAIAESRVTQFNRDL